MAAHSVFSPTLSTLKTSLTFSTVGCISIDTLWRWAQRVPKLGTSGQQLPICHQRRRVALVSLWLQNGSPQLLAGNGPFFGELGAFLDSSSDGSHKPPLGYRCVARKVTGDGRPWDSRLWLVISPSSVVTRTQNYYISTRLFMSFDLVYNLPMFGSRLQEVTFFEINWKMLVKVCFVLRTGPARTRNQDSIPLPDLFRCHESNGGLKIGK